MSVDTQNPVSWQSAFWGLLPIAVNTFLQKPGSIIPSKDEESNINQLIPDRVFRSSPFICLVDALDLLVRIFLHLARGDSFGQASRDILAHRGLKNSAVEPESQLPRVWALRAMVGTFALIQLVKLCGMQGILWTAFSGCCYFVDWALLEILDAAKSSRASSHDEPSQPLGSERALYLSKITLVISTSLLTLGVFFWMYGHLILVGPLAKFITTQPDEFYWGAIGATFLLSSVAGIYIIYSDNMGASFVFVISSMMPISGHLLVKGKFEDDETLTNPPLLSVNGFLREIYWVLFAGWPILCTFFFVGLAVATVTKSLCVLGKRLVLGTVQAAWGVLLSCSFVVVLLHYAWRQDFSQTNKPEWVEWLG